MIRQQRLDSRSKNNNSSCNQNPSPDAAFVNSFFKVTIFNYERDKTLACWNDLQAMWGTDKAFIGPTQLPVELDGQKILNRFKTIGYSKLSGKYNKEVLVTLNFNKTLAGLLTSGRRAYQRPTLTLGFNALLTVVLRA